MDSGGEVWLPSVRLKGQTLGEAARSLFEERTGFKARRRLEDGSYDGWLELTQGPVHHRVDGESQTLTVYYGCLVHQEGAAIAEPFRWADIADSGIPADEQEAVACLVHLL